MADCLKILVLHGYRQSAQTCREKLGAFRKGLKKLPLEFVYITAPNKIPSEGGDTAINEGSNEFGWWFSTENDTYDPLSPSEISKGYEESLELVKTTFADKGPFDGILGFSQGSCLLSILCALREEGCLDFKFAILVAGFKSRSLGHSVHYNVPITCPTLHVFGDTDRVIPKVVSVKAIASASQTLKGAICIESKREAAEKVSVSIYCVIEAENSEELLQYFTNATILNHPGGHFVPTQAPQRKVYIEFLEQFLNKA